jgi:hypothetical protein
LRKILPLLLLVIVLLPSSIKAGSGQRKFSKTNIQAIDREVQDLLAELSTKKVQNESGETSIGPSLELQHQVPKRILEIAKQSPKARARVIYWLIGVLDDPAASGECPLAEKWITAVGLLGVLGAREAIGVLIDNLDRTGQNGLTMSINFRPVVGALINIGKPAVPKLIAALSHDNPSIRAEAAGTLAEIRRQTRR